MIKGRLFLFIGVMIILCSMDNVSAAPNDAALGDGMFARITTTRGDIVVRLEYQKAPLTVCNFAALAEGKMNVARGKPFYDGLTFHRVVENFMIQGGDPAGNGTGGPGYKFPDEFVSSLKHDGPGMLSMANAGPNTNGSQFFITHTATPHLDGRHSVFGRVVEGQNVVNSIRQGDKITKITIIRNGAAAAAFKADQENFDRLLSQAADAAKKRTQDQRNADIAEITKKYPDMTVTQSGIRYEIQKQGTGNKPAKAQTVKINYKGTLISGKVFDSSDVHGPLEFLAGMKQVIPGMDEMVMDMKLKEKRLVIIPPELAYGERSMGNGLIPANSFLIFDIELISIY